MTPATLGLGYAVIGGVLVVIARLVRRIAAADALALIAMWPVYAPVWWLAGRDDELISALALARGVTSPASGALPDADDARALARRLRDAGTRLTALDALLARPGFDPDVAAARARELAASGAIAAAATAQLRVHTLGQLVALRTRYRRELDEVGELIAQLVAQAELARFGAGEGTKALVIELVARVEAFGELAAAHEALERGA